MKKIVQLIVLLVTLGMKAYGNHEIGGELKYECIAPNTYKVTFFHYCPGVVTTLHTLNIKAPGCNTGRSISMSYIGNRDGDIVPAVGITPYKISEFSSIVSFTPSEQTCQNWILSVLNGEGRTAANLNSATGNNVIDIYTEAELKLGNNLTNNSPVFDAGNLPVLQANRYQPIVLSVGAIDPDGDSLAYSMVAPLLGHNQPVTNYAPIITSSANYVMNPEPLPPYNTTTSPQIVMFTPAVTSYSPAFPLLSYSANFATQQPIVSGTKNFILDAKNGSLSFTPMYFDNLARNTYLVSVRVDEYRKINGIQTKIGSVRRETVIIIGYSFSNVNPKIVTRLASNPLGAPISTINVNAGSALNLRFTSSDVNFSDVLQVTSNAGTLLPGSVFQVASGNQPTSLLTWTPTAAHIRPQPYYLRVFARDNATSFSGLTVETIAVYVKNSGITGTKESKLADLNTGFIAFPNPFISEVNFRIEQNNNPQSIEIYNALGQKVDQIFINIPNSETKEIAWGKASKFAAGSYFARLINSDKSMRTIQFNKLQ